MYRIRLAPHHRRGVQHFPSGSLLLGFNDANGVIKTNPLTGDELVTTERLYGGLYIVELVAFASVQVDVDLKAINDDNTVDKTWRVPITTREFRREYKIKFNGGKMKVLCTNGITGQVQVSLHWERVA